jgi:hypothetical protein
MDYILKYYLDELQLQRANVLTIITKEISVGVILDFLFIDVSASFLLLQTLPLIIQI